MQDLNSSETNPDSETSAIYITRCRNLKPSIRGCNTEDSMRRLSLKKGLPSYAANSTVQNKNKALMLQMALAKHALFLISRCLGKTRMIPDRQRQDAPL
ncbi:hypothetical protein HZ326_2786 [Fusarium oxysporum f. sp. albedinis]|nr:hypothetical protein HZ326_2786 [Fusarium oxysporum f. sp. albedinis]